MAVVSVVASPESNAAATKTVCKHKLQAEHGRKHGEGTLELLIVVSAMAVLHPPPSLGLRQCRVTVGSLEGCGLL